MRFPFESWIGSARTTRWPRVPPTGGKILPRKNRVCSVCTSSTARRYTRKEGSSLTLFAGPQVMFDGSNGMTHETTLGQLFFLVLGFQVSGDRCTRKLHRRLSKTYGRPAGSGQRTQKIYWKEKASASEPPETIMGGVRCVVHKVSCTHRFDDSDFEDDDESSVSH